MSEGEQSSSDGGGSTTVVVESQPVAPTAATPAVAAHRERLVRTAVRFLQNPNVVRSTITQKQAFLRTKGLTEDEVQLACERAGVFTDEPTSEHAPNQTVISMGVVGNPGALRPHNRTSWFGRLKDLLSSAALFGGLLYGAYLFYKKLIEPFIFRGKKAKPVEEQISELTQTVEVKIEKLNTELVKMKEELLRANQAQPAAAKEFSALKSDLNSIKGLLLNRKQFASPNLPMVPPSIPAWQLQAQASQAAQERTPPVSEEGGETDKNDDNDTGSGSGSSENDVVLKNSDSSLEIIS